MICMFYAYFLNPYLQTIPFRVFIQDYGDTRNNKHVGNSHKTFLSLSSSSCKQRLYTIYACKCL